MNKKTRPIVTPNDLRMSEERKKTIQVVYYISLTGSAVYIVGLFLPFFRFDDFSVLTIDYLYFGRIYALMMGFVGVVSIIGIIIKRDLLKLIFPNIIACILEVVPRSMYVLLRGWIFYDIIGPGLYITFFGATIAFLSPSAYLGITTIAEELNRGIVPPDGTSSHGKTGQAPNPDNRGQRKIAPGL